MKNVSTFAVLLAFAGFASAQSSVTLFGVVDVSMQHIGGNVASVTRQGSSGLSNSRLGFRGREDLGGGLSASFWLEAQLNPDSGQGGVSNSNNQVSGAGVASAAGQGLTFNRRSTISLESAQLGELRIGRDFTSHFLNTAFFDPFGATGMGASQVFNGSQGGVTSVRYSNMVGYYTPRTLGGVYGQLQVALGENASNTAISKDGNSLSWRLGYAHGPLDFAISSAKTRYARSAPIAPAVIGAGDITVSNIGGSYDFGIVKAMIEVYRDRVASTVTRRGDGFSAGGIVPVANGDVRLSYSAFKTDAPSRPETTKLAVGYTHNFSRRTALYATYASVKNAGGATQTAYGPSGSASGGATNSANASSSGLELGLRHTF